jgi:hypothetical protein
LACGLAVFFVVTSAQKVVAELRHPFILLGRPCGYRLQVTGYRLRLARMLRSVVA